MRESCYPSDNSIGLECLYWDFQTGCFYPKIELQGRRSCEGIIDSICVYILNGVTRLAVSKQIHLSKFRPPYPGSSNEIPPGFIDSVFDET